MTLTEMFPKLYPGMYCSGIEFFIVEDEVKMIANGKVSNFTELSFPVIQLLRETIEKDSVLKMALMDWHPNSEYKRLEQFAKCRFGGLDFEADIKENVLQSGEYWDCPLRATCPSNGLVCKAPKYNNQDLTPVDIALMKMTSTSATNEVIAEELHLHFGTFHKLKKALYDKLKVQTKQEVALIARSLNLI
jgi:DNA-binding CsgD family transcriptional regulator